MLLAGVALDRKGLLCTLLDQKICVLTHLKCFSSIMLSLVQIGHLSRSRHGLHCGTRDSVLVELSDRYLVPNHFH